jgi:hypothetical protein
MTLNDTNAYPSAVAITNRRSHSIVNKNAQNGALVSQVVDNAKREPPIAERLEVYREASNKRQGAASIQMARIERDCAAICLRAG